MAASKAKSARTATRALAPIEYLVILDGLLWFRSIRAARTRSPKRPLGFARSALGWPPMVAQFVANLGCLLILGQVALVSRSANHYEATANSLLQTQIPN